MVPELSIVIVNYKTPQLIFNCLRTVYDQTKNISFEVLVVDNDSGDDSQQIICNAFPHARWLQMGYNAGFARANNEGIRQASGDVILLLNSDTLNENNAIGNCFELFRDSADIACGVQLLNIDRSPQISGNFVVKGGLNHLLPLPYIGNLIKFLGTAARIKKPNIPSADGIVEVDWINGAFLMVKKAAIDKAGLMDEDFFLYAEEAEWCSRLKKVGRLCIYGQFKLIHLQGASANQVFGSSGQGYYNLYDKKGFQIMLSNFVRIRKQFGISWFIFHLLVFSVTVPLFFLVSIFDNLFSGRNPLRDFPAAANFAINTGKLWSFTRRIISNKPYFYKAL
jgi:GT2 family glycosyltransferase